VIVATITTSPNAGIDTITVTNGNITSSRIISVLIDDTKPSRMMTPVPYGTLIITLEPGSSGAVFGTSAKIFVKTTSTVGNLPPLMMPGAFYDITAQDSLGNNLGTENISGTVTVSFPYPDRNDDGFVDGTSIKEGDLMVFQYEDGEWRVLSATLYIGTNTIVVTIPHFSTFALLGTGSFSLSLGNILVYPNPYYPSKGHTKIIFGGDNVPLENKLTRDATIRIYTIAGELVKEIIESDGDGKAIWEHPEKELASGVYIYLIQSPGKKDMGKIGVVK
jgi:signal peptidase I